MNPPTDTTPWCRADNSGSYHMRDEGESKGLFWCGTRHAEFQVAISVPNVRNRTSAPSPLAHAVITRLSARIVTNNETLCRLLRPLRIARNPCRHAAVARLLRRRVQVGTGLGSQVPRHP